MGRMIRHITHFLLSIFVTCGFWVVSRACYGAWGILRLSFQLRSWDRELVIVSLNHPCLSADSGKFRLSRDIHRNCMGAVFLVLEILFFITTGESLFSMKLLDVREFWCGLRVLPSLWQESCGWVTNTTETNISLLMWPWNFIIQSFRLKADYTCKSGTPSLPPSIARDNYDEKYGRMERACTHCGR